MGQCPFCQQPVDESLLRFGGPCPKCFNEIPGDEAATDPGAALRAKEAAVEAARRRKRQVVNAVAGVLALLALSAGGWWAYQERLRQQQILTLDFDEDFYTLSPEEFAVAAALTPEPAPTPGQTGKTRRPRDPAASQGGTSGGGDAVADAEVPDRLATDPSGAQDPSKANMGGATGGATGGGPGLAIPNIGIQRKGVTLSDPDAITEMIGTTVRRYRPQLQSCYESRLRENPEIQGTWDLSFVVSTSGTPKNIQVEGRTMADEGLEACIQRNVSTWNFSPIVKDQEVAYPLKLRSQG